MVSCWHVAEGVPFGEYRLLRRLGGGGMAEVFLARREGPAGFRKDLVIKRILPHLARSEGFVRLFLHEARVAALIDHPNLVHVSAFGEIDGEFYLAMEYVDGFTLADLMQRVGKLTPGAACRIGTDLLEALDAIHSARDADGRPLELVHRDVSLRNVMLTRAGAVKLLDFGIAVVQGDGAAPKMGTRQFMSPEQQVGGALDGRSDLYMVGGLLRSLMVGGAGQRTGAPSEIPAPLWSTIESALQETPAHRPSSARAMLADLEIFLASRGAEGTRTHLADLLRSVFPASQARPVDGAASRAPEANPRSGVSLTALRHPPRSTSRSSTVTVDEYEFADTVLAHPPPPPRVRPRWRWIAAGIGALVMAVVAAGWIATVLK